MPDILHELTIEGKPEAVYKAITEQDGLSSWWTVHATAQPKVGAVDEFRFGGGQIVMKMEVSKLEPGKAVQWKALQGAPDWGGTQVTWDLTPIETGTKLLFGHRDYASTEGSFASVSYQWAWFLTSLKSYIETGKGTPNTL
ncbi:MAG: SRPBCC domain-containing protein [Anaerolineae bacterium]